MVTNNNLSYLLCSVICLAPMAAGFVLGWSIRARTMGKGLLGMLPEFVQRLLEKDEE